MFGFIFGMMCLFGMGAVLRTMAWDRGMGWRRGRGHWGGGWSHHGRAGGRRDRAGFAGEGFARAAGEVFKRRLDIDEDQEGIVDHALIDLRKAMKGLAEEFQSSRPGIADALRGDTVDETALAAIFARQDDAMGRARREVVSSVKQIHAVLEAEQRNKAADWVASNDRGWI